MITNTSLQAFFEHKDSGKMGLQRQKVYDYIRSHHGCTRRMIEKETRISISSVTARTNELINETFVSVIGISDCPITRRKAELLGVSTLFERD